MKRATAALNLITLAMSAAMVAGVLAKAYPSQTATLKWHLRHLWSEAQRREWYAQAPAWLREAADVRGMRPGDDAAPLTATDAPAWPAEAHVEAAP